MGESFGAYKIGRDADVVPYVSSVNIACGFHAGDPDVMAKTVKLAAENGVGIGAHPGLPDLVGFGRRNMNITPNEAKNAVLYQIGALDAFCAAVGVKLCHVKPHGALYNMAAKNSELAAAICEAILEYGKNLTLLALANSEMTSQAKKLGLRYASEVFADRAYEDDGTLVARSKPGAVITDENEAVERVVSMIKTHKVKSINNREIEISPDSVCVHGDNEKALLFVKKIRSALEKEGIAVRSIADAVSE